MRRATSENFLRAAFVVIISFALFIYFQMGGDETNRDESFHRISASMESDRSGGGALAVVNSPPAAVTMLEGKNWSSASNGMVFSSRPPGGLSPRLFEIADALHRAALQGERFFFQKFALLNKVEQEDFIIRFSIPEAVVDSASGPEAFFGFHEYTDQSAVGESLGSAYASSRVSQRERWFESAERLPPAARQKYRVSFAKAWMKSDPSQALAYFAQSGKLMPPDDQEVAKAILEELQRWKDEELLQKWRAHFGQ